MRAARTGRNSVEWAPLPPRPGHDISPQALAYNCPADVLFYGGAAGGGKTDLLIGLSLKAHQKSIIFRREFPQLEGIEDRCREIVGELGSYNSQKKLWRIYDGRRLEFGAVEHLEDRKKYQGRPHDLIGFDEITHFLKAQFDFLQGWLRTTDPGQRCRIVCTGNPPQDEEGSWVIDFWGPWLDQHHPRPAKPGELRWYAMLDGVEVERPDGTPFEYGDELITPKSRTFIPALVQDNPHYWNTGYVTTLQSLPEPLRSQLLKGDFAASQGDDAWQVIPTAWVKKAMERWQKAPPSPMTSLGVDVARGGDAKTVLAPRHQQWFGPLLKFPGKETPDGPSVAREVVKVRTGHAYANLDVVGYGAGAYEVLKLQRVPVYGLNGAEKSEATDRSGRLSFVNLRAEWHWRMREALDPEHGEGLQLPNDRELLADLCAPRWKITVRGIQVESKEEIVRRLGRSPDCGDAVIYAHAVDGQCVADFVAGSTRPASGQLMGFSGGSSSARGGF